MQTRSIVAGKVISVLCLAAYLSIPPVIGQPEAPGWVEHETLTQQTSRAGSRVLLRGKVEHSHQLPALDPRLLPGHHFDASLLKQADQVEEWIKIPSWFAGEFQIKKSVVTSITDYVHQETKEVMRPQKAETAAFYGHQRDSGDNIWHLNKYPFYSVVHMGSLTQYATAKTQEFLEVSDDRVVIKLTGPAVIVRNLTGKIVRASQTETIVVCYPDRSDVMAKGSIKSFDASGSPIDCAVHVASLRRFKPFHADPSTEVSFKRFLVSRPPTGVR